MNRRDFLRHSALAGTVLALPGDASPAPAPAAEWFDRPMRWAQLTLVEDDPGTYDLAFWLDYFRRTHSDAACLSAGGCVAYYPTKIPLHYRSQWLGKRDAFGDLVAGCRKLNMVVIARTDPHAAHQDVCDAHPDWIAVDADGKKSRHRVMPALWITCALGPYNFEFMTDVTKEIVSLYKVDGIFSNRWSGSGMCYCEHCRENFHAALRHGPAAHQQSRTTRSRRAYIVWRQQRLFELWRLWDGEIRKINPDARYIPNSGGGASADLDMKTIGELRAHPVRRPAGAQRRRCRPGPTEKTARNTAPPWAASRSAAFSASAWKSPIAGRTPCRTAPEIRLWVLDGIANGLRPWFTKFAGTLHDRRWLPVVEDLYGWHYRNERYLRNERPLARVAMVYSQQTAHFYGGEQARQKVEDHTLGYYQALIEARIPFEMVHDRLLDAAHIDPFKVLILPNIAALSTAQCAQIRDYVQRGGSIVATYETSLYDEWGVRRADFGLADLFGASFDGALDARMQNSYLRLETDPATGKRHPLLAGLEDAEPHHQRRFARRHQDHGSLPQSAPDADSLLSRPSHGRGLPARSEDRHPRSLCA